MRRTFNHLGVEWEANVAASSSGAGFFGSALPPLTSHSAVFRSTWGEFRTTIESYDPDKLTDEELRRELDRDLERRVLAAINGSRWVWRPAEAISKKDTGNPGIPAEHVRRILETTKAAEVIRAPFLNKLHQPLYTTREHLIRTTADAVRRYGDVEDSSS